MRLGFRIDPQEKLKNVGKTVKALWNVYLKSPVYGVVYNPDDVQGDQVEEDQVIQDTVVGEFILDKDIGVFADGASMKLGSKMLFRV